MNKEQFMTRLKNALLPLSEREKKEILRDYEDHFRAAAEAGRSEEETAESLGFPEEIAKQYISLVPVEKLVPAGSSFSTVFVAILLIFLNILVLCSPVGVVLWCYLAGWIVAFGSGIVGVIVILAGFINVAALPLIGMLSAPIVFVVGLCFLAFAYISYKFMIFISKSFMFLAGKYIKFNVDIFNRLTGAK